MEKNNSIITEQEARFCLLYVNAPAPLTGDVRRCYKAVFGCDIDDTEAQYQGYTLMNKECVKNRIDELVALNACDTMSLKAKITSTLTKIMDECAEKTYKDRFGKEIQPAALRAVSVNAAKTLNDMYGIKEDIAHTVNLKGEGGEGIVFNINVPQPNKEEDEFNG